MLDPVRLPKISVRSLKPGRHWERRTQHLRRRGGGKDARSALCRYRGCLLVAPGALGVCFGSHTKSFQKINWGVLKNLKVYRSKSQFSRAASTLTNRKGLQVENAEGSRNKENGPKSALVIAVTLGRQADYLTSSDLATDCWLVFLMLFLGQPALFGDVLSMNHSILGFLF